jgi:lipoyl(octanoyl) transferase
MTLYDRSKSQLSSYLLDFCSAPKCVQSGYAPRGENRLIHLLEQSVIDALHTFGVVAIRRSGAPGVYIGESKVAALGLRVKRGCTYHGLALNVDMDLGPFGRINPCGYPGLSVTQTRDHGILGGVEILAHALLPYLIEYLGYSRQ